jgi:endonuclease YncB( thermonuclease family)
MKSLTLLLLIILSASDSFTGNVVKITDGDTIVVLTSDNKQVKIRLEGIDCPESNQDFGNRAKQAVSDLCFGREVVIVKSGEDRYGRTLGYVFVGDVNVNKELLRLGLAWHYKQYNKDTELASLELAARNKKIGLWSHPNPVAPWDFRRK